MAKKPLLGRPAALPASPDKAQLDRVANPHRDTDYVARFTAPEFTTLCPITGQPDFAHLVIDYVPGQWLVESKSLKLYLASFRNQGSFHEDCTVAIGKRVAALCPTRASRPIAGAVSNDTCPGRSAARSGALQNRDPACLKEAGPRISSAALSKRYVLRGTRGTQQARLITRLPGGGAATARR